MYDIVEAIYQMVVSTYCTEAHPPLTRLPPPAGTATPPGGREHAAKAGREDLRPDGQEP